MRNFATYAARSITDKRGAFYFFRLSRTAGKELDTAQLPSEAATCKAQIGMENVNPLKTKRRLLYLKPQSVPRCKHFSSRL